MKGNKEGVAGSLGGGSVAETGALFPRLHVKETKRVGPRAPPRNKMALYEQFTFPSHRFVPPALPLPSAARPAGSTTYCPQQRSTYDGSMYYCPAPSYAGMPWLPYMTMNTGSHLAGQPSVNGSCSSTVVDGEGETRRAPSVPASGNARPSSNAVGQESNAGGQGNLWTSSHANVRSISCKKARSNDDCTVPTYTAPNASSPVPRIPTGSSDQFAWRTWQQHNAETTNTSQAPSVSCDNQVESLGQPILGADDLSERGVHSASARNRDDTGDTSRKAVKGYQGEEGQTEQKEWAAVHGEKHSPHLQKSYPVQSDSHDQNGQQRSTHQHREKKGLHLEDISDTDGLRSCATASGDCSTVVENEGDCGLQQINTGLKARALGSSQFSESHRTHTLETPNGKKDKKGPCIDGQKLKKHDNPSECRSSSSPRSDDEMENFSDAEVPERSESEAWSDSEESDASIGGCETSSKPKIASRDIVKAIGEQEFWTARKLLQRQQKIFSGQVFELHRLIKVQQLLATSPNLLMDDGKFAAPADKAEEMSKAGQPDQAIKENEDPEAGDDQEETHKSGKGKDPDSTCQSSSSSRACLQPPNGDPLPGLYNAAQVPTVMNVAPGASTVPWNCQPFPKADGSHWYGAIPPSNAGYMYQPYPGSFHPSQAHAIGGYSGAYRPLMCPPIPMDVSMNPFGMPGYEQRSDSMQDMYRFNSYQQQQWQGATVFCPGVPSNPGATWYSVPPMPYMDPTHRGTNGLYDGMMAGSSGHANYFRPGHQTSTPSIPAPHPSGSSYFTHSPWTGASAGQQSGCEGDRFRAQAHWSSSAETSAPGFQRPPAYSSGQDPGVSAPQEPYGAGAFGWQPLDENGSQTGDCTQVNVATGGQNHSADKSDDKLPKRNRDNSASVRSPLDRVGERPSLDGTNAADSQRDALPLFPLCPPLYNGEKGKLSGRSSSGVIKVVPRAMVATPESAAEILLFIQKQREQ